MSSKIIVYIKRTIFLILLLKGCFCFRKGGLVIPDAVERGKPFVIKCVYDLEHDELYQVRWYQDNQELFRFTSKNHPPVIVSTKLGIEVNWEESNADELSIKAATSRSEGHYSCVVTTTNGGRFKSVGMQGSMYVVDLPKAHVEINGVKERYQVGMELRAECILRDTRPPANLTFYINDEPTFNQRLWRSVYGPNDDVLWTSYVNIHFRVRRHHFIEGKMKIRCLARIFSLYYWIAKKTPLQMKGIATLPPPYRPIFADDDGDDGDTIVLTKTKKPLNIASQHSRLGFYEGAGGKLFLTGLAMFLLKVHVIVFQ